MSHFESVKEFQKATGFEEGSLGISTAKDYRRLKERVSLIAEEFQELVQALGFDSVVDIGDDKGSSVYWKALDCTPPAKESVLKEMCDLAYVVEGTAVEMNFKYDQARERVHQSNMTKCIDGKVQINEHGKVIKPSTYVKPDLKDLV